MPVRIQRKRTKGWRMPEGAIYVGRPTLFGNPFTPEDYWNAGYSGRVEIASSACVKAYREWLTGTLWTLVWEARLLQWAEAAREDRVNRLPELRGKDLACWCRLNAPCHADVLLEIANAKP